MILERTLQNGLDLVVKTIDVPVVSVQVWVDVGSLDEKKEEAGYCHFLEHMLFKGTKKRTTSEIAGSIEGSGGEINAFTSFEHTVYFITLPASKWKLAIDILQDMLFYSEFIKSEFDPEKLVILEEIAKGEDEAGRVLFEDLYKEVYGTSGYGRSVIGFPSIIKKSTPNDLKKFWKSWYTPQLMTLVVCGGIDSNQVSEYVNKNWSKHSGKKSQARKWRSGISSPYFKKDQPLSKIRKFSVQNINWAAAFPGPSISSLELPAIDLGTMVLAQGEASRLFNRLYRKDELVSTVSGGVWAPIGNGIVSFEAESSVDQGFAFREPLFDEIHKFMSDGPTAEELERAKVLVETDRTYSLQTMDSYASRLGYLKSSLGNVNYDLEYLNLAKECSIEDVKMVFSKYLNPKNLKEISLVPKEFSVKALKPIQARKSISITSKKVNQDIISHDLPNGIKLVLSPREDMPVVSFYACSQSGIRVENSNNAGVGSLISGLWDLGPKNLTALEFSQKLDSLGSSIESFSGRNSMGLSGSCLSNYLPKVLPLFFETLDNPAFDEREFNHAKAIMLEELNTSDDDLYRLTGRLFIEQMCENHPYGFNKETFIKSIRKLDHQSVHKHFEQYFSSQPIVVSVAGKFDPDFLINSFSKMHRHKFKTQNSKTFKNPLSPLPGPRTVECKKNREQSHIMIGFRAFNMFHESRFALKIISAILGGQSGRLFLDLRDKQGLCYTVSPTGFDGVDGGYFGAYIGCDSSKIKEARESILRIFSDLSHKKISTKELLRAKEFLVGRNDMDLQLSSSLSSSIGLNVLYGFGEQAHNEYATQIQSVSAEQVQETAQKIFGSPQVLAIVV